MSIVSVVIIMVFNICSCIAKGNTGRAHTHPYLLFALLIKDSYTVIEQSVIFYSLIHHLTINILTVFIVIIMYWLLHETNNVSKHTKNVKDATSLVYIPLLFIIEPLWLDCCCLKYDPGYTRFAMHSNKGSCKWCCIDDKLIPFGTSDPKWSQIELIDSLSSFSANNLFS